MKAFSHPSNKIKQAADINQNIETTITISRNEWKYDADLETHLATELPMVVCEIDEINQVFLNFIINAVHAIQEAKARKLLERGKIIISTECLDDNEVVISVTDTGIGIPDSNLERIFDPFFTTKPVGKGTGQGLSLAHSIIVKEHGGRIEVKSEENKGTTFTIHLPICPAEKGDPAEKK